MSMQFRPKQKPYRRRSARRGFYGSTRPAPANVRPPQNRPDRPPDGWELIPASFAERLVMDLDSAVLRIADSAARNLTRRDFLDRAGRMGLLAGLSMSGLLWRAGPAQAQQDTPCACNCLDPNNQLPGPCGPTALCSNAQNCNDQGNCKVSISGIRRRNNQSNNTWPGTDCAGANDPNCWVEDCCAQGQGVYRCCDCCTNGTNPPFCTGSGCTNKHKCVCRKQNIPAPC